MEDRQPYFPQEWHNDERMGVLLGPMPHPENSVSRSARFTFWSAAIHHWCRVTHRLSFTLQECRSAFKRGTQQPLCLPDVLLHMNSLGEILPQDQVPLGEQPKESWIGWGRRVFIAGPSHFAWTKLKNVAGISNVQSATFVNMIALQEMCDRVLKTVWESSLGKDSPSGNRVLTVAELYRSVGKYTDSCENLLLVVAYLAYTGQAATLVHKDTTYVKFCLPGDTQRPAISQTELAEDDLQRAQEQVESNIAQLNQEIAQLQSDAKRAISSGAKAQALSMLKRKKRLEKSITTNLGVLENVSACLHNLQDTRINKQVIGAYRVGVEAIRAAVAGDGSADSAANTMDDLQQVLDECEDINSVLASGVRSQDVDIDDAALEEELGHLVQQDSYQPPAYTTSSSGMELPEVPKNNPLASLNSSTSAETYVAETLDKFHL